MLDYVNDEGTRVMDEDAVDALTALRKVRPARGAFGDWNKYDAEGNVSTVVIGAQVVSEMDDLRNDWGYATQTEQRMYERGDEPEYDRTAHVWYSGKGDKVELRTEYAARKEPSMSPVPGYHVERYGYRVTCWYCAYTFDALTFVKQADAYELTRSGMEHFVKEMIVHSAECYAEHDGLPLIRMYDYAGKSVLRRASYAWGKR